MYAVSSDAESVAAAVTWAGAGAVPTGSAAGRGRGGDSSAHRRVTFAAAARAGAPDLAAGSTVVAHVRVRAAAAGHFLFWCRGETKAAVWSHLVLPTLVLTGRRN